MKINPDYILCECDLSSLKSLVSKLETQYEIVVTKAPSVGLVMLPAEDSLDQQPFYLGEALMTECEVLGGGRQGYGICLGDDSVRSYCLAVVDSLLHADQPIDPEIQSFLTKQQLAIERSEREEFNLVLRTQVDFKLMENQ